MTDTAPTACRSVAVALIVATLGCHSSPALPDENTPPPPPAAKYSIDFDGVNAYSIPPGQVLNVSLKIRRQEGFEAPIDLEATAAPGIVVIFRPDRVIHRDDSSLLVVAEASTPRRTHQIQFSATSADHPTMTAVLSLTVVDPE